MHLSDTGTAIDLTVGGVRLYRYEYRPELSAEYAPRPYLHPVATRAGVVVTDAAPDDHPWHHGIGAAVPMVAGSSFWGGPTYVSGRGYVALPDHGRIEHVEWLDQGIAAEDTAGGGADDAVGAGAGAGADVGPVASLRHRLVWVGHDGRPLLAEDRAVTARLNADPTVWTLRVASRLRNLTDTPVELASPATAGRVGAGYGGWFVRAAPRFRAADVGDSDGRRDEAVHGERAASVTMACATASITVTADPVAREPWFVRRAEYPGLGPALAFRRPLRVAPDAQLTRAYRIDIADRGPRYCAGRVDGPV
ncbi:PmoA family protein [Streptomyces sp. NPDC058001]|uniref:DUF6807 domain-containing protein n=1 Tax=Streptomyces sp. NPDC058001 TaxID=3346300 RepID=UPI0036E7BC3E